MSPKPASDKPPRKAQANPLAMAGAAMELGIAIAGLALVGWWLDSKFTTTPWLMMTGLAMGLIGGTYNIWKMSRKYFGD